MSSNLADLPLSAGPPVLTSCGQDEFKFGRSTPFIASRCTPQYWHLQWSRWVQIWSDLPLRSDGRSPPGLTSCGQDEFKFARSTPRSAGRSIPRLASSGQIWQIYPRSASRCTPLLTSSGKEWQFRFSIVTAHIRQINWQIYPPVLTSCGQDDPFIPRTPEIPTSKFSGVLNTMAKVWKL